MKSAKISIALATFNEEKNIIDCFDSVKHLADEIVVVDGFSEDRTVDLAKKFKARIIKTTNKLMFHINKNIAFENCKNEWILLLDADERVTNELSAEIRKTIESNPKENGFWINRKNWFLGGFLTKGGAYPDSVIRLFRRGKGRLPEITVHEQIKIDGDVGYLKNDLVHLADPSFSRYLIRADRYTEETAKKLEKLNPGRGMGQIFYYSMVKPLLIFLNIYVRNRGYVDGFRGFIWALFSGVHIYLAYVKYWEKSE